MLHLADTVFPRGGQCLLLRVPDLPIVPHTTMLSGTTQRAHTHTCWRVIRSCDRGVNSSRDEREEERKEEFRRGEQV